MLTIPSETEIARIRMTYPCGTKVEVIKIDDPLSFLKPGDQGRVAYTDDLGMIHVKWERGIEEPLIIGLDKFRKVARRFDRWDLI